MAPTPSVFLSNGQAIGLGKELGRGGEGAVYELQGASDIAVKIYHHDRAAARATKITAMTSAGLHSFAPNVAFPIEALFDEGKRFVGFTMRRVGGHHPVHNLYSPTSRKSTFPAASFQFLLRTALNISFSVASVHRAGCIIGDINHSGILIANNATVTLIDCDSFQVQAAGQTFPCTVGVPEFTPPELQGKRLDRVLRTLNHDHFGLAVLIFNLLFMGRHPFAGRFLGRGEMPMEMAIAQYRFAYSSRRQETRMEPPPGVPLITDIPQNIADAFEAAFGQVGTSVGRPKAEDWVRLIQGAEKQITWCARNSAHHYFNHTNSCPWCRMEGAYPGFLAFVSTTVLAAPSPTNLAQLLTAIRSVPNPGPAPDLAAAMPQFQGNPSSAAVATAQSWIGRYVVGVLLTLASFEAMHLQSPGPLAGLLMLGGGVLLACRHSDGATSIKKGTAQAKLAWQQVEDRWKQTSGSTEFVGLRTEAEEVARKVNNLPSEETRRLADLKNKQRESQLKMFLERYYISKAVIKGIGGTRTATLRSYGIETAADVVRHQIESISGFGPTMAGNLLAWRTSIERNFLFDPKQPIDPAEIRVVKNDLARQHSDSLARLGQIHKKLQQVSNDAQNLRSSLKSSALNVWNQLKQLELDLAFIDRKSNPKARLAAFVGISIFGLIIVQAANTWATFTPPPPSRGGIEVRPVTARDETSERIRLVRPPDASDHTGSAADETRQPSRSQEPPISPSFAAFPAPSRTPPAIGTRVDTPIAPSPLPAEPSRGMAPPFGPAVTIGSRLASSAPTSNNLPGGQRDFSTAQRLLIQKGFLEPGLGSTWDQVSKDAFRDFKAVNGLPLNDSLDGPTERKLNDVFSITADRSFVGNWTPYSVCGSGSTPLRITSRRAVSAGGYCEFQAVDRNASTWRVRALCAVDGRSWIANIKLALRDDLLTWTSERGSESYRQCK